MPTLMKLGRSHFVLGVRPEYFDIMRECLLDALAVRLGSKWTREGRVCVCVCVGGVGGGFLRNY